MNVPMLRDAPSESMAGQPVPRRSDSLRASRRLIALTRSNDLMATVRSALATKRSPGPVATSPCPFSGIHTTAVSTSGSVIKAVTALSITASGSWPSAISLASFASAVASRSLATAASSRSRTRPVSRPTTAAPTKKTPSWIRSSGSATANVPYGGVKT